jgi:UDP-GlcNAc:undecaprenyl-phosphate GlcNAc-1-phosphate transferase
LLGGVAVFAGVMTGVLVALHDASGGRVVDPPGPDLSPDAGHFIPAVGLGLLCALVLGLVDDRRGMRPATKLLGQAACALPILFAGGGVNIPGVPLLGTALSLVWVVTVMNAANFADNMDGVLTGVTLIAALGLGILATMDAAPTGGALAFSLVGAASGFLLFNFPPASIFLGDAGSLVIGYCLAAAALLIGRTALQGGGWIPPVLALAYLLFDITFVTVIRLREKRPVYLGGIDHSSHRLRTLLGSSRRAVLAVYVLATLSVLAALTAARLPPGTLVLFVGAVSVCYAAVGGALARVSGRHTPRDSG